VAYQNKQFFISNKTNQYSFGEASRGTHTLNGNTPDLEYNLMDQSFIQAATNLNSLTEESEVDEFKTIGLRSRQEEAQSLLMERKLVSAIKKN